MSGPPPPLVCALAYAVAGWPVLPLHTPTDTAGGCSCRHPDCPSPGKHPRTPHGLRDASTLPARIAGWWRQWPDANIGARTGPQLVVLDVDGPAGAGSLAELEAAHSPLPATRRARTSRGEHLYFHPAGRTVATTAGRLGPGLDVRGHGGYIVAPPSQHPTGNHYAWTTTTELAPLPAWLARALAPPSPTTRAALPAAVAHGAGGRGERYLRAALDAELAGVVHARENTRNITLNRAAFRLGQLLGAGLGTRDRIADALLDAALHAGLGELEARRTIASGLTTGQHHPRPLPPPKPATARARP